MSHNLWRYDVTHCSRFIVGIAVTLLQLAAVYATDSTFVKLPAQVRSFAQMDSIGGYGDLPAYGLLPPGSHSHEAGANLIMLAVAATYYGKGNWAQAIGSLGVTMLNVSVSDRIGYYSLFDGGTHRFKMQASYSIDNNGMLVGYGSDKAASLSSVTARESAIYRTADAIRSRFAYDQNGNHRRLYEPQAGRGEDLMTALSLGYEVLEDLASEDYADMTLRDCLGMTYVVPERDQAPVNVLDYPHLGPLQVYRDALHEVLQKLAANLEHSYDILDQLGWAMSSRGLAANDKMLLPDFDNPNNFQTFLAILRTDLESIDMKGND